MGPRMILMDGQLVYAITSLLGALYLPSPVHYPPTHFEILAAAVLFRMLLDLAPNSFIRSAYSSR